MGYSMSVQAPTPELQDKMYNFLEDNWEYFHKHDGSVLGPNTALSVHKGRGGMGGISYAPDDVPNLVGFDYSSWISIEERIQLVRVIEWMCKVFNADGYYYDHEFTKPENKSKEEIEEGLKNLVAFFMIKRRYFKRVLDFVFDDVERLRKLWEE